MYIQWRGLGVETKSLVFLNADIYRQYLFSNFTAEKRRTLLLWSPLKYTRTGMSQIKKRLS
jgi:hypothetical protein